jgi:hypothetical protein
MCICLHPDPIHCTAQRHDASLHLVSCLDAACRCRCHKGPGDTPIVHDQWYKQREPRQPIAVHPSIPYGKPKQGRRARLTAAQVVEIRQLAPTQTRYQLAERYGVSYDAISDILNGKRWRSVESEEIA